MGEPIQQSRRHAYSLEHLAPITEREIAGDQRTGSVVAVGEQLERHFSKRLAPRSFLLPNVATSSLLATIAPTNQKSVCASRVTL